MKYILLLLCLLSSAVLADQQPVSFEQTTVRGLPINLVTVDLSSPDVEIRPILAPERSTIPFQQLLRQGGGAYTAITGTFFDPATGITVGNVVHKGRLMTEGSVGSVLTIGEDNVASVRSLEGKMGRHIDWAGTKFAVSAGPTLVTNSEVTIDPSSEGFRDGGLYGNRMRAAMGVTAQNKLLLLTSKRPVSLHELARIFQELGAVDAVNLDGGSSTALYHNGQVVSNPSRRLTNLIAIYAAGDAPDQAGQLSSQYAVAYNHYMKGLRYQREGQLRLAHSHVRKALSMAPDRPPYWEALGQIQEQALQLDEAAEAYLKAAELYLQRAQNDKAKICADFGFALLPRLRGTYPSLTVLMNN